MKKFEPLDIFCFVTKIPANITPIGIDIYSAAHGYCEYAIASREVGWGGGKQYSLSQNFPNLDKIL